MIKMPPFVRIDDEVFGLHQCSQHVAVSALFVGTARVIGRGPFRKFVKTGRHRDQLTGLQIIDSQVHRAASVVLRAPFRVRDKLALVQADDIPKQLRDRPRPIAVEDHKAEAFFSKLLMHPHERFRRRPLKKSPSLSVNGSADKIVRRRVSDIELYRVVEFCELYQMRLGFVSLLSVWLACGPKSYNS